MSRPAESEATNRTLDYSGFLFRGFVIEIRDGVNTLMLGDTPRALLLESGWTLLPQSAECAIDSVLATREADIFANRTVFSGLSKESTALDVVELWLKLNGRSSAMLTGHERGLLSHACSILDVVGKR